MSRDTSTGLPAPGFIEPANLYTLDEVRARLGWKEQAFRTARRQGLRILRHGNRGFVRGSEIIRFLEDQEECDV
jgi:hypothetical protein